MTEPVLPQTCDLCGESERIVVLALAQWSLACCVRCGLVRLDPAPTLEQLSAVYDTAGAYYTHEAPSIGNGTSDRIRNAVLDVFWNYPSSLTTLRRLMSRVLLRPLKHRAMPVAFPGDAPVLDIGCGNGQRLLELQHRGCTTLFGVEPTEAAAVQARLHTKADIRACLLEQADLPKGYFKLIIMNQVLEHVPSPSETLRHLRSLLRQDGQLYLTVPNYGSLEARLLGSCWAGLQAPAHLHHFTPRPLRRLIEQAGFRIDTWRTDTVLAVTAAGVGEWARAKPSVWRRWLSEAPRGFYLPAALLADRLGRGQMLRVVASKS
jgi:SAM-dependent methyltransferase